MTETFTEVELVGGPFCGAVTPWPDGRKEHAVTLMRTTAVYELERSGKAVCKGWLKTLRK